MANYILTEATARGLQELLADRKGIRQAKVGQTVADDGEPLERPLHDIVWSVRWSQENRAYLIYLGSDPLFVNGQSVMPTGVSSPSGYLAGMGWYVIDSTVAGEIYLSVKESGGSASASIGLSPKSGHENITIARVSYSGRTGERIVRQNLLGTLVISGATEGFTGSVIGDCEIRYNSDDSHNIELWGKVCTYDHGLLKSVGDLELQSTIPTTPHVSHDGE